MPGLSSNIMVNGANRLSVTQLNTHVLGDLEVTGNLSVSGTGGGTSLSAPVGSGLTIDGNDILLNHDNSITVGFDEKWPVAARGTRMATSGTRTTAIPPDINHFTLARSMQRLVLPCLGKLP